MVTVDRTGECDDGPQLKLLAYPLAALALAAVLLAGCGGGADPGARVEESLRNYLGTVNPDETGFPVGAGLPRVRHNACRDGHVKNPKGSFSRTAPGSGKRSSLKTSRFGPASSHSETSHSPFVSKRQVLEIFRKEYPQLAQSQNSRWAPDALVITPKRATDARRVAALFGPRSRYGINLVN